MNQIKVELQGTFGNDRQIAESAWTSSLTYNGKLKRTDEDVERVINMLAEHKHSTPFESIVLRFWIKMPISVDRQFMTHRLQSSSGMSGRYRSMPSEYLEVPDDVKNIFTKIYSEEADIYTKEYNEICDKANKWYKHQCDAMKSARDDGFITNDDYKRIREFSRGVLPQHNMTERVSIMNLRAFCNFIKLRDKPEAQPEIREVARLMLEEVKKSNVAPIALAALEQNGWII